ncbi:hypothetical protein BD289DRAFT_439272 [Coniella lustricola]|uniref:Uncharacterized protein n=1 Tax=Coniella lustricola TaxID=2025994 RepID=A0A2T3A1N6_9PEZI|nr:hypothetical protein BD289DRAFT_439272 [Coniella lustricola]
MLGRCCRRFALFFLTEKRKRRHLAFGSTSVPPSWWRSILQWDSFSGHSARHGVRVKWQNDFYPSLSFLQQHDSSLKPPSCNSTRWTWPTDGLSCHGLVITGWVEGWMSDWFPRLTILGVCLCLCRVFFILVSYRFRLGTSLQVVSLLVAVFAIRLFLPWEQL